VTAYYLAFGGILSVALSVLASELLRSRRIRQAIVVVQPTLPADIARPAVLRRRG
jgi:hypothetical protein